MKNKTSRKSNNKSNNKTNNNNQFICPKCNKHYTPKYATIEQAKTYSKLSSPWVEQHLSGICSDLNF